MPHRPTKLKDAALAAMEESRKTRHSETTFTIDKEEFAACHMPRLYSLYQKDPAWLEEQVLSLAKVWHNGSICSAAQALESDLATM